MEVVEQKLPKGGLAIIRDTAKQTAELQAKMFIECFGLRVYDKYVNSLRIELVSHLEDFFMNISYKKRGKIVVEWTLTNGDREYGYRYIAGLAAIIIHKLYSDPNAGDGFVQLTTNAAMEAYEMHAFREVMPLLGVGSASATHAYHATVLANMVAKNFDI